MPDKILFKKELNINLAEALDVEGIARYEVPQPLHRLRRADQPAGATAHRLALLAHRMAAAGRTDCRKLIGLGVLRPLVEHHADDLRNDVACALDRHRVTDADVHAVADFGRRPSRCPLM